VSTFWGFGPSRPIRTDEGIQAHSQRGAFAKHWWASRWIEALEQLMDPGRLQRGRRYARSGQVLAIDEAKGGVEARVQGSRPKPYKVKIALAPLSGNAWEAVLDALAERAAFAASLLAGEMPAEVEDAFRAAKVSLFPDKRGDLEMDCSCPDWAIPCKHVAAVHYLLAERLDADPFLLFRLRGRGEAEVFAALRARQAVALGEDGDGADAAGVEDEADVPGPLSDHVANYWRAGRALDAFATSIEPPALPLPVLKRLGPPPFADKDTDIARLLGPAYGAMTRRAVEVDAGGQVEPAPAPEPTRTRKTRTTRS